MQFRLVCLSKHCSAEWDSVKAGFLTCWHNDKTNFESLGFPCFKFRRTRFIPGKNEIVLKPQLFFVGKDNLFLSSLNKWWFCLVGILWITMKRILCVYVNVFRTGKVFKCFFFIANLSKN